MEKFEIMKYHNSQMSLMCELLGKTDEEKKVLVSKFNEKWKVNRKGNDGN